jgi:serine/threonine protein kinase
MLKHEASVLKSLGHPKIIRFVEIKKDKTLWYLVMEYFPSINLKQRLIKKDKYESFIKPNLRKIIDQLCVSMSYMHEKKWIHRDIKPDNVLVNGSGETKLIDFALAVKPSSGWGSLFGKRHVAGTRSYMSPEQIIGKEIDQRADIYSFGVMLYEITSGKLPFFGDTGNALLRKHLNVAPPSISAERNLTPEFKKLLFDMLAKKPDNRPASMNEVAIRLKPIRIFADERLDDDETQGTPGQLRR